MSSMQIIQMHLGMLQLAFKELFIKNEKRGPGHLICCIFVTWVAHFGKYIGPAGQNDLFSIR